MESPNLERSPSAIAHGVASTLRTTESTENAGFLLGGFGNHSELTGVTRNLRLDFLVSIAYGQGRQRKPAERNHSGSVSPVLKDGRVSPVLKDGQHLDPGEQMAHRGDVDICPIGTRAVGERGDIHKCAVLAKHKRAAR